MTITDDRLRKLASLRGDKYQEEAEMARELLALRQSSPPDGQTADGWIEWKGGELGVLPPQGADALVLVRLQNGYESNKALPASHWYWHTTGGPGAVAAYHVIPTPSAETQAPGEEH